MVYFGGMFLTKFCESNVMKNFKYRNSAIYSSMFITISSFHYMFYKTIKQENNRQIIYK